MALMRQPSILAGLLGRIGPPPGGHLVDLGSGDGSFMLRVLRRLPRLAEPADIVLVDRSGSVGEETRAGLRALGLRPAVTPADIFTFLEQSAPAGVICANLFLHHFTEAQLQQMFALSARKAGVFVACEPRRGRFPLLASRLLWAVGANDVTRHDAPMSVKAGFARDELSTLWPQGGAWHTREFFAPPFTHAFLAWRSTA
jgi:SAM-dependent MidA family methyltransferase